jgi:hypothetical protein
MKSSFMVGALLAGLALSSGCTSWSGHKEGEVQTKMIKINRNNFKIAKSKLMASASCTYLFPGMGSLLGSLNPLAGLRTGPIINVGDGIALGNPELYEQAYKKLREQAAMEGKAQQLFNICEEATLTSYLVIGDYKLTLTADVIEFTGERQKDTN